MHAEQSTSAQPPAAPAQIVDDWNTETLAALSGKNARLDDLLPVIHSLSDRLMGSTIDAVEKRGESVSCGFGCAACCRHMVPLSEAEARRIRDLVHALPEPRRAEILGRFAEARRWLEASGLLPVLQNTDDWNEQARPPHGWIYRAQEIACPFLENETCSIYAERPLACREHLVTSPAANCTNPSVENIRCVEVPVPLWRALARFDETAADARNLRWVPLVLAPEWADAHPEPPPVRLATELVHELVDKIAGAT